MTLAEFFSILIRIDIVHSVNQIHAVTLRTRAEAGPLRTFRSRKLHSLPLGTGTWVAHYRIYEIYRLPSGRDSRVAWLLSFARYSLKMARIVL